MYVCVCIVLFQLGTIINKQADKVSKNKVKEIDKPNYVKFIYVFKSIIIRRRCNKKTN